MKRIYTIPTAFTEEHISVDYTGDLTLLNTLIGAGIAQESATTTDRSARGPLTRWAAYYLLGTPLAFRDTVMAAMGISTPGEPANLVPGDANPFFNFIDSVGQSGNNITRQGGVATLAPINDDDLGWIDIPRMLLLFSVGDAIGRGLDVHFVVAEADYGDDVPVGFPNGTITEEIDEEPVTRQRTWAEWKSEAHEHYLIDGNYYIPSTSWGVHLNISDWAPFALGGAVSVVKDRPVVEVVE